MCMSFLRVGEWEFDGKQLHLSEARDEFTTDVRL